MCAVSEQDAFGGSADVEPGWPSTMGCLNSTLGNAGKMVAEVPASSVVETVYSADRNGISTAVIVNGHGTTGHEPVSPEKITMEEDPTVGALTTKKVHCYGAASLTYDAIQQEYHIGPLLNVFHRSQPAVSDIWLFGSSARYCWSVMAYNAYCLKNTQLT